MQLFCWSGRLVFYKVRKGSLSRAWCYLIINLQLPVSSQRGVQLINRVLVSELETYAWVDPLACFELVNKGVCYIFWPWGGLMWRRYVRKLLPASLLACSFCLLTLLVAGRASYLSHVFPDCRICLIWTAPAPKLLLRLHLSLKPSQLLCSLSNLSSSSYLPFFCLRSLLCSLSAHLHVRTTPIVFSCFPSPRDKDPRWRDGFHSGQAQFAPGPQRLQIVLDKQVRRS